MSEKIILDEYKDNFEHLSNIKNLDKEMLALKQAAKNHLKRKKSITIRVSEIDLEAMQIKASKLGIPYQTYINMVIHKDAISGL